MTFVITIPNFVLAFVSGMVGGLVAWGCIILYIRWTDR